MARTEKSAYSRFVRFGLVLQVLILASLACNYPQRTVLPSNLPGDALRQTLSAQEGATSAPLVLITTTPENVTPVATGITSPSLPDGVFQYTTHPGDTLTALQARFATPLEQYLVSQGLPVTGYLPSGMVLTIPSVLSDTSVLTPANLLLPDSEAINSPTSVGFDVNQFVQDAGGFLSGYQEIVDGNPTSGAEIVQRVASESSVSPRILLAFLEYRTDPSGLGTGWVYGQPGTGANRDNPLGFAVPGRKGLYQEMVMAATHLNIGYYGWRAGTNLEIRYSNGKKRRLHPLLNPGSAGIQNLFAKLYEPGPWQEALYGQENFMARYHQMFGDPWERAAKIDPPLQEGLSQPILELPFAPGERWSFSGGPHPDWNTGSPRGALDFSPVTGEATCAVSKTWARASAPGVVARAAHNVVALDLDGDGNEQTGWVLVYVHLANHELVKEGAVVTLDDPLGHPSCERGQSTGKHVHLARKYNGEWLPADDPVPFILSGWRVVVGPRNYQGDLVKGDQVVSANSSGARRSIIQR
jgi:LasA protease